MRAKKAILNPHTGLKRIGNWDVYGILILPRESVSNDCGCIVIAPNPVSLVVCSHCLSIVLRQVPPIPGRLCVMVEVVACRGRKYVWSRDIEEALMCVMTVGP